MVSDTILFLIFFLKYGIKDAGIKNMSFLISFLVRKMGINILD